MCNKHCNFYPLFTSDSQDECYTEALGEDYRGHTSMTESGLRCQKWTSQEPHSHITTPDIYNRSGLGDHNYCRNPNSRTGGIWCYTSDPGIEWEYCNVGLPKPKCNGKVVHFNADYVQKTAQNENVMASLTVPLNS